MKKREEKRPLNYIDCLSSAAIVLMPFIVVGALLFLNGYGIHFSMLVPGRGGYEMMKFPGGCRPTQ